MSCFRLQCISEGAKPKLPTRGSRVSQERMGLEALLPSVPGYEQPWKCGVRVTIMVASEYHTWACAIQSPSCRLMGITMAATPTCTVLHLVLSCDSLFW